MTEGLASSSSDAVSSHGSFADAGHGKHPTLAESMPRCDKRLWFGPDRWALCQRWSDGHTAHEAIIEGSSTAQVRWFE